MSIKKLDPKHFKSWIEEEFELLFKVYRHNMLMKFEQAIKDFSKVNNFDPEKTHTAVMKYLRKKGLIPKDY